MRSTAKLAFDMLEKEMEVLNFQTLEETKGGTEYKYITNSMTGMIERYHSNSLGASWYKDYDYQGSYDTNWGGPSSNTGGGSGSTGVANCFKDPDGIYARYETYLNDKISGALSSGVKAFFMKELAELTILKTSSIPFTIRNNIGSEKDGLTYNDGNGYVSRVGKGTDGKDDWGLIAHEIEHQNQIERCDNSSGRDLEVKAYMDSLRYKRIGETDDYYRKWANGLINLNSGEGQLYPASYKQTGDDPSGYSDEHEVVSTGFDDIGWFGVYETVDSSGNLMSYIQHPYGEDHNYYGTSGYSPDDNWNNMTGILSSGADDYGNYFNYAYNDEYENNSTGYYHPDLHASSTGASTGTETTGG